MSAEKPKENRRKPTNSTNDLNREQDNQTYNYYECEVKPIYSQLISSIVKEKPQNIVEYCTKWFKQKQKSNQNNQINDEESSSENEDQYFPKFVTIDDESFFKWRTERLQRGRKNRYGLSSEKLCRSSLILENGEKKEQASFMRILFFCMNNFLFYNFTQKQIGQLIEIMKPERFNKDAEVCREGQFGDKMYFVDEGMFQCMIDTHQGLKSLKNYYVGDTFGEICLLHNMKRQASIFCRSNTSLVYYLERQSYIHFKKMCMIKKRTLYLCTLIKQQLFSSFRENELQKICDVLCEVQFQEGVVVINQGDVGTKFYIILEGISVAYQGRQDNIVRCYKEGDGFGEIALIKDTPRQASVKTLTRCRMVYITRDIFKRIFENLNLQKQVEDKYANKAVYINKRRPDVIEDSITGSNKDDRKLLHANRRVSLKRNIKLNGWVDEMKKKL